ncbi:hypothetical protein VCRA2120O55_160014 [Vibrio crassostreae]|nr:hypothetical protein VCRA2117O38_150017 [Vibrio crassostreae]CAK1772795.1 hypothetical protein VCRA2116O26_150017 [Vibrio crassostreae]CAK1780372.1 hypothetical protein VCRA2117O40_150017 [Vibrio crassostreae]CAK1899601.1 hypothetical protein VCRA2113O204_200013 [Vibrio crassostreae]CAK1906358.1 hypothetical protein VCRA2113O356_220060 [Vibrio crassostreae]
MLTRRMIYEQLYMIDHKNKKGRRKTPSFLVYDDRSIISCWQC